MSLTINITWNPVNRKINQVGENLNIEIGILCFNYTLKKSIEILKSRNKNRELNGKLTSKDQFANL